MSGVFLLYIITLAKNIAIAFFMRWILRVIQIIYCIYAFSLFALLTLIAFPLVMLSLLLGYHRGGNLIYIICKYWAATWFLLIGVRHKEIFESPHDTNKQWVFVANHISYMDIPPIVLMAPQPIRILGKYESSKIPIFGWIYRAAVIMVDRSNAETRAQSFRALKTGTPIKPMILPDTIERLHFSSLFTLTPGICRVIFLEEVAVTGLSAEDIPHLRDKVYSIMDQALRKYRRYPS